MNIDAKVKDAFYNSSLWKKMRKYKITINPYCECTVCTMYDLETDASEVHHIIDIDIDWSKRLLLTNLMSINHICHSRITMINNQLHKKESEASDYDAVTKRLILIALGKQ